MERSLLALHQGPSPRVAIAIRHFYRHSVRQPYCHLASQLGRLKHRRRHQSVLPGDGAPFSSSRLLTRHNKSMFWNALDGHGARWFGTCVFTAGYHHFFGRSSLRPRVVDLQSDSALGTKHRDAVQEALREGRRSLLSQHHRCKGLRIHRNPKQATR